MVLVPGWRMVHPELHFSSSCEFPKCFCWGALVGATPLHLLSQTALPLKSPTGAFIASLRFANAVPPQTLPGTCTTNWNLSGRGPSICSRRPFGHLKAPLGLSLLRKRGPTPNPARNVYGSLTESSRERKGLSAGLGRIAVWWSPSKAYAPWLLPIFHKPFYNG